MIQVVNVRFRENEKSYFFAPNGTNPRLGDKLVVETIKGLELGECVRECHEVEDSEVVQPLRPVVRMATEADLRVEKANRQYEEEAFGICAQKIAAHGLDMKLVRAERSFDGSKILFFFTSDGRVDFRELVKDLAAVFRTRIELRQIGVRDEAKLLGGLGICGRPFCCSEFLTEFQPVSTKMAKVQSMSLNPTKISGSCGRLMCCLRYEYEAYEDMIKHSPKTGAFVETESGYGTVTQVNLLRHQVKVKLDDPGAQEIKTFDNEDVAVIPEGRPPEGVAPPHLLQPKAKPVELEFPEEDPWELPGLFSGSPISAAAFKEELQKASNQPKKGGKQRQRQQGKSGGGDGQSRQKQGGQSRSGQKRQTQQNQKHQPRSGNNPKKNNAQKNYKKHYTGAKKPRNRQRSSEAGE